jgi:hypothetical protein
MKPGGLQRDRIGRETRQSILGSDLIGYGSDCESVVDTLGRSTLDSGCRLGQKGNEPEAGMGVQTVGEAYQAGWRIHVRCAWAGGKP